VCSWMNSRVTHKLCNWIIFVHNYCMSHTGLVLWAYGLCDKWRWSTSIIQMSFFFVLVGELVQFTIGFCFGKWHIFYTYFSYYSITTKATIFKHLSPSVWFCFACNSLLYLNTQKNSSLKHSWGFHLEVVNNSLDHF
jgi:hypothetical protein